MERLAGIGNSPSRSRRPLPLELPPKIWQAAISPTRESSPFFHAATVDKVEGPASGWLVQPWMSIGVDRPD